MTGIAEVHTGAGNPPNGDEYNVPQHNGLEWAPESEYPGGPNGPGSAEGYYGGHPPTSSGQHAAHHPHFISTPSPPQSHYLKGPGHLHPSVMAHRGEFVCNLTHARKRF